MKYHHEVFDHVLVPVSVIIQMLAVLHKGKLQIVVFLNRKNVAANQTATLFSSCKAFIILQVASDILTQCRH